MFDLIPLDPDQAVSGLDDRGDAVGRAAGTRDDPGLTIQAVDAVDHGRHGFGRRRRGEDHVRRTGLKVLLQALLAGEDAGALQHQIDAEVGPRQVRRVTFGERHDPGAVDEQRPVYRVDFARVAPVDGVVLDQVGQVLGVGDVVDCDEVEPVAVDQDLQRRSADSS